MLETSSYEPIRLASHIDHTLLRPAADKQAITTLCREARHHGFRAVCVNPYWVELVGSLLAGSGVLSCVVLDFPLGASPCALKVAAARYLAQQGVDEIDMVVNLGALHSGAFAEVQAEVAAVRQTARACQPNLRLKVIIETSLLAPEVWEQAVLLAAAGGADYIKTSTGFGPRGASVADVERIKTILRRHLGDEPAVHIKASGGIRNLAEAQALLAAGAERLGSSAGVAILAEAQAGPTHQ